MRALLTFLLIVIIFSVVVGPYADGYLVKRIFINNIEQLQSVMASQHSDTEIVLDTYDLGWFESKAVVSIKDKNTLKTKVPFHVTIHHGPLVFIDSHPTMALAYLTADTQSSGEFPLHIKLTSVVPFDQHVNITKFSVDPVQLTKAAKWDGLNGETTIIKNGNLISDIDSQVMIGKIIGQEDNTMMGPVSVVLEPATLKSKYQRLGVGEFTSSYSYQAGSVKINATVGSMMSMKSASLTGSSGVKNNLFNTQIKLQLDTVKFNPEMTSSLSDISNLQFTFAMDNLNQTSLLQLNKQLKEQKTQGELDYHVLLNDLVSALTSKTTLDTNLSIVTPEGTSSAHVKWMMTGAPKALDDLARMSNGKVEVHVTKPFFKEIVKHGLSIFATAQIVAPTPTTDVSQTPVTPPTDAHAYYQGIADLVKSGAINTNQSVSLMSLPDKKLGRDALDATLDTMSLSPTVKASVMALYVQQFLPETPVPAATSAVSSSSLTDPEALIGNLIEKGIIKDEGSTYSFVIEKTGQEIKINGNTDIDALTKNLFAPTNEAAISASSTNNQVNDAITLLQGVSAAANELANGNYTNSKVTFDNIKAMMPGKSDTSMDTPWGTTLTFSVINATSYKVALPTTPEDVCKQLSSRLVSNPKYTKITPISDCLPSGTDFTYIFDNTK